jgi:hypothetical protein
MQEQITTISLNLSSQHELNLPPVTPRMPGADQHHQLHSSSSHHERTYKLSSKEYQEQINTISFSPAPAIMTHYLLSNQECQEQIKTISFISAPATKREPTCCQAKNARSRSTPSASFQLQPP